MIVEPDYAIIYQEKLTELLTEGYSYEEAEQSASEYTEQVRQNTRHEIEHYYWSRI